MSDRFNYQDAQSFPDFVRYFTWNDPLLQQGDEVAGCDYTLTVGNRTLQFTNHSPSAWYWRVQLLVHGDRQQQEIVAATFRQPFGGAQLDVPSSAWWFTPKTVVTWLTVTPTVYPAPEFFVAWREMIRNSLRYSKPSRSELDDLWVGVAAAEERLDLDENLRLPRGEINFNMLRWLAMAIGRAMLRDIVEGKLT